jgi:hypothetical protein
MEQKIFTLVEIEPAAQLNLRSAPSSDFHQKKAKDGIQWHGYHLVLDQEFVFECDLLCKK